MSNFNNTNSASGFQGGNGLGDSGFDQRNPGFQTSGNNFESDRAGLNNNLGTGANIGHGGGFSDDLGPFNNNQAGIGSGAGRQLESTGMTGGSRGLGGGEFGGASTKGYGQVTGGGIASEAGIPNSGAGTGIGSGARNTFDDETFGRSHQGGFGNTATTGTDRPHAGEKSLTEKAKDIYHDLKAGTGDVSGTGPSHTGSTHANKDFSRNQDFGRTDGNNF